MKLIKWMINLFRRLISIFKRPIKMDTSTVDISIKNKIIAVDFDGTLVKNKYPMIGPANLKLIRMLKELKENNTLILWTCRSGKELDEAVAFCKIYDLSFDYINCNSIDVLKNYKGHDSRKITADIYIDDKAMTPNKFVDNNGVFDYD